MKFNMNTKAFNYRKLLNFCIIAGIGIMANAQPGPSRRVESPIVNADNTVTFNYAAPRAKDVKVSAQFEKAPVPMVKDSNGIWTVKLGPIKPDMYPYSFIVDGVQIPDPSNSTSFPNEGFKNSIVEHKN
jgi:enterochelin esterase family protein